MKAPLTIGLDLEERKYWTGRDRINGKLILNSAQEIKLCELDLLLECKVNIGADQKGTLLKLRRRAQCVLEQGVVYSRRFRLFPASEVANKEYKLAKGERSFPFSLELTGLSGMPPSVGNSKCGVVWVIRVRRKRRLNQDPEVLLDRTIRVFTPLKRRGSENCLSNACLPLIEPRNTRRVWVVTEKVFDIPRSLSRTHSALYDSPMVSKIKVVMRAGFCELLAEPPYIELYFSEPELVQVTITKICMETICKPESGQGAPIDLPPEPLVDFNPISVDQTIELLPRGRVKAISPTFTRPGYKIQHFLVIECWGVVKGRKKHHRLSIRHPVVVTASA